MMTVDHISPHEASGRLFLTAIHVGQKRDGLAAVTVLRWRDEAGQFGQSSHSRLANFMKEGGQVCVERQSEILEVAIDPKGGYLYTLNTPPDDDPILALPSFSGHK